MLSVGAELVVLQIPSVGIEGGEHSPKFHQSIIRVTREWHDGTEYEDIGVVHRYLECQPFESVDKVKLAQVSYFSSWKQETSSGDAIVHGLKRRLDDQFVDLTKLHDACLVLSPHRNIDPFHSVSECAAKRCRGRKSHYVVLDFTSL